MHDAARAFTPKEVFDRVKGALEWADCVVPTIKLSDTVKQVNDHWVDTDSRSQPAAACANASGISGFDSQRRLGKSDFRLYG